MHHCCGCTIRFWINQPNLPIVRGYNQRGEHSPTGKKKRKKNRRRRWLLIPFVCTPSFFFALCRRVPKCRTTPTTPRHRNLGVRFVLELQMEASACYKAAAARGTRPPLETRLERKPVAAQQAGSQGFQLEQQRSSTNSAL